VKITYIHIKKIVIENTVVNGWTDNFMDGWTARRMDGWMEGRKNGCIKYGWQDGRL
jgi:hypothetical protein